MKDLIQSKARIALGTDYIGLLLFLTKKLFSELTLFFVIGWKDLSHNAKEFECLVELGMDPSRAIYCATLSASELLQNDKIGVLEKGRYCDLIGLKENPVRGWFYYFDFVWYFFKKLFRYYCFAKSQICHERRWSYPRWLIMVRNATKILNQTIRINSKTWLQLILFSEENYYYCSSNQVSALIQVFLLGCHYYSSSNQVSALI